MNPPTNISQLKRAVSCSAATAIIFLSSPGCAAHLPPAVAADVRIANKNPDLEESINAVERLGHSGTFGIDGLISLLDAKRVPVRTAVVVDLGRIARKFQELSTSSSENSAASEVSESLSDGNKGARPQIDPAIYKAQIAKITGALGRTLSNDKDWTVRRIAAAVLGVLKLSDVDSLLIDALDDDKPAVRQQAATSLASRGPDLNPKLIETLALGSDNQVKYSLALIGKRGVTEAVEAVLLMVDSSNWEVRSQAMLTLGQLKDQTDPVNAALVRHLADPEPRAALYAARALISIGRPDGIEAAVKRFPDKELIQDFEKIEKREPTEDPSQYVPPGAELQP